MFFIAEENPWKPKTFFVSITNNAMIYISNLHPAEQKVCFSYQYLIIALFGLRPKDFYHYITKIYNATIITEKHSVHKNIVFNTRADAQNFVTECNRRFSYCVKEGFFNE